jgi:hypothetical protein
VLPAKTPSNLLGTVINTANITNLGTGVGTGG